MFRLANFIEENKEEGSLYRYLSDAISKTIVGCLDEYLDNTEMYDVFFSVYLFRQFLQGFKPICVAKGIMLR